MSLPSSVSPWNSIFGPGQRSKYNTWGTFILFVLISIAWKKSCFISCVLRKNDTSGFEQILETTLPKTAIVRLPTSYLIKHPSKIKKSLRHRWRSKYNIISIVLQWTPTHVPASVSQKSQTDIHQICVVTGRSLEDRPGAVDDRDRGERESRQTYRRNSMQSEKGSANTKDQLN